MKLKIQVVAEVIRRMKAVTNKITSFRTCITLNFQTCRNQTTRSIRCQFSKKIEKFDSTMNKKQASQQTNLNSPGIPSFAGSHGTTKKNTVCGVMVVSTATWVTSLGPCSKLPYSSSSSTCAPSSGSQWPSTLTDTSLHHLLLRSFGAKVSHAKDACSLTWDIWRPK